jgi:hypothetical protein
MAILIASPLAMNDEEFQAEMDTRRERLNLAKGQAAPGCPLCGYDTLPSMGTPANSANPIRPDDPAQRGIQQGIEQTPAAGAGQN